MPRGTSTIRRCSALSRPARPSCSGTWICRSISRTAPRVRHELNYRAKLYFGQQVTTTVVVEKIGRTSMTFSFEVWGEEFRGEPRVLAAHGSFVTAHVARGGTAATPWPAELAAKVTAREAPHG